MDRRHLNSVLLVIAAVALPLIISGHLSLFSADCNNKMEKNVLCPDSAANCNSGTCKDQDSTCLNNAICKGDVLVFGWFSCDGWTIMGYNCGPCFDGTQPVMAVCKKTYGCQWVDGCTTNMGDHLQDHVRQVSCAVPCP